MTTRDAAPTARRSRLGTPLPTTFYDRATELVARELLGAVLEVSRRGRPVGILPGEDREAANGWVEIAIATGLGELRNGLVVRAADAIVAVGGGHGTLSEVALALKLGRPVVGLGTWEVHGVEHVSTPAEAIDRIATLLLQS